MGNHYDCSLYRPFSRLTMDKSTVHQVICQNDEKPEVFISGNLTERLIQRQVISEQFSMAQQLYQYLHWTLRINKLAQTSVVMEGRNGRKVVLFDVELHDQHGQTLYALCTPNDMVSRKSQPWQLAHLWTASQLTTWLGITTRCLPRGVRAVSPQFEGYRNLSNLKWLKSKIQDVDLRRKPNQYAQVKCIQTGRGQSRQRKQRDGDLVVVSLSTFYLAVRSALVDDDVDLVPILSIISKTPRNSKQKKDFSVDYLLPVRVKGQWLGVVYREMIPIMVLMDRYDITNKAMICDPSFNAQTLCGFRNCSDRLRIVPDHRFIANESADDLPRLMTNGSNGSNQRPTPRLTNTGSNHLLPTMMSTRSHPVGVALKDNGLVKRPNAMKLSVPRLLEIGSTGSNVTAPAAPRVSVTTSSRPNGNGSGGLNMSGFVMLNDYAPNELHELSSFAAIPSAPIKPVKMTPAPSQSVNVMMDWTNVVYQNAMENKAFFDEIFLKHSHSI